MLSGEARQRALVAWHAGWQPALEVSGRDWVAPFLAPLLSDPYSVVRIIASRSIRSLPGYEHFEFVPMVDPTYLSDATQRARLGWRGSRRVDPAILMRPDGLDQWAVDQLLGRRDDRPVGVIE